MPFETFVTLESQMVQWSKLNLSAWAITFTFMHGFQNNLAQLFIWNICSDKLKVKVTLEGQTKNGHWLV